MRQILPPLRLPPRQNLAPAEALLPREKAVLALALAAGVTSGFLRACHGAQDAE